MAGHFTVGDEHTALIELAVVELKPLIACLSQVRRDAIQHFGYADDAYQIADLKACVWGRHRYLVIVLHAPDDDVPAVLPDQLQ